MRVHSRDINRHQKAREHDRGGRPVSKLNRVVAHRMHLTVGAAGHDAAVNQKRRDDWSNRPCSAGDRLRYPKHAALLGPADAF